jgi:hypothetical protein
MISLSAFAPVREGDLSHELDVYFAGMWRLDDRLSPEQQVLCRSQHKLNPSSGLCCDRTIEKNQLPMLDDPADSRSFKKLIHISMLQSSISGQYKPSTPPFSSGIAESVTLAEFVFCIVFFKPEVCPEAPACLG